MRRIEENVMNDLYTSAIERVLAVDVVAEDCGYGYVAHVLMSDGSRRFFSAMKPSRWEAKQDTMDKARESSQRVKEAATEAA